jgi:serine/threonine protein kinase
LAVATAIAVLTLMGAWSFNVWFPWMVVSGAQVPLALSWSLITLSAGLWRERRAFEQALALATKAPFVSGPSFNGDAAAAPIRPANLPRPLPPEPGVPVVPGYQLLRCIGQGAYGRVWLARDILGSFHAVKVLRRQSFKDPLPLEREFRGLSRFTPISRSHPGFVHILHVGWKEEEDFLYYAMELADDEQSGAKISIEEYSPRTLAGELARRGRCPLEEVVELGIQLADALEHLHRHQLIHRDIKPSNILFVKGAPKFADIGLVTEVTRAGGETNYLGTPGRIAPEGPGTPASDVYGLGMVLYETGLGMPVERFPELPPFMIQAGADPLIFEFNRVVMRACEFQERRRYPSAAALRDDLAGLRARMKAQSSPGSGPSRT